MMSEVVARAAAGDAEAFTQIVTEYEPRICRFLYGLVGDRELARDLAQETFLSAYRGLQRGGGQLQFNAWLYTIARNQAVSALRRRRLVSWLPLPKRGEDREEETGLGQAPDPADVAVDRLVLREALARLDVTSRALLVLAAEGFSYAEIGQMLGLSLPAVRLRLFRARERLRALCPERGDRP
ncbi:MAG: sigma-70 family RNA polymerase sigma factor [Dehalococcoidales bacterium]|nr:sigma-70 family RNA polymerase sigma factor [Dehalococcoidales bacterium]